MHFVILNCELTEFRFNPLQELTSLAKTGDGPSIMYFPALDRSKISDPIPTQFPAGFPFNAAMCAIALDSENAEIIYSAGCGPSQAVANFVAEMEAVERYSIVYSPQHAPSFVPIMVGGGPAEAMPQERLTLRSPGYKNSSKGTAASTTIADAAQRALLELVEHLFVDRFFERADGFAALDLSMIPEIASHAQWAKGQLRTLSCSVADLGIGCFAVICRSSDIQGSRPTYGSGAALSLGDAVISAVQEALFSWRNMIEIERNGLIKSNDPEGAHLLNEYRGAVAPRPWPLLQPFSTQQQNTEAVSTEELLQFVARISESRVQVFDLTHAEVGLPVARAQIG